MPKIFKTWIFNQFPKYYKETDANKDINGQGVLERYLNSLGMELDDNLVGYIDNFMDILDIIKTDDKYLPLLGGILGYPPSIDGTSSTYRKILSYAIAIYKIKGTLRSFQMLFNLLGLDVGIIEVLPKRKSTYNDGITFYDKVYEYDSDCEHCSGFYLKYSQVADVCSQFPVYNITPEQLATINNIICFLSPINATFLGLVKDFKLCDEADLTITDESNLCPIPTGVFVIWDSLNNIGKLTWLGTGNFEVGYKLTTDTNWTTIETTNNFYNIPMGTGSGDIYNIRVRHKCDTDKYSAHVNLLLFKSEGIINHIGTDLTLKSLIYKKNVLPITMLSDYSLGYDYTDPILVKGITVDNMELGENITINNITELNNWLNTLNLGTFSIYGNNIVSLNNGHLLGGITYILPGDPYTSYVGFDQLAKRALGYPTAIKSDYSLAVDYSQTLFIQAITIDGVDISGGNTSITNETQMLAWLNSLGKGTFISQSPYIVSLDNTYGISLLKYKQGSDNNIYQVLFHQTNISANLPEYTIYGDYSISLSPTPNDSHTGFNIKITGYNVDGVDYSIASLNITTNQDLLDYLNNLSQKPFTIIANSFKVINTPQGWRSISYIDNISGESYTVAFNQTNVYIGLNAVNSEVTIDLTGTIIVNDLIWDYDFDAGNYSYIRIKFAAGSLVSGGKLYTSQYGAYTGYMDAGDLVFNNIILGDFTQIIIN